LVMVVGDGACLAFHQSSSTHRAHYRHCHCNDHDPCTRTRTQIDRARAIFTHGSNYADPKRDPGFWKKWQDFEVGRSAAMVVIHVWVMCMFVCVWRWATTGLVLIHDSFIMCILHCCVYVCMCWLR
jgi:hypothetical protein